MIRGLASLSLLLVAVAPLSAQAPELVKKLTVGPAALPALALKYQFLPELRDTTPGNAALFYQRAHSPEWWATITRNKALDKVDQWLEVPLDQVPPEAGFVRTDAALRELDFAARHEYCSWELTGRLKREGFTLLIPDVQAFRSFAALLAVRCRLELADGKLDKSVHTMQTGFKLGRDIADAPTLIQALVGMHVCHLMADRVEELIQRPQAPNVYWALSSLPQPLIDLRKPSQGERLFLEAAFPELKTIETTVWDAHEQKVVQDRLDALMRDMHVHWGLERKLAAVGLVIHAYPQAKQFLLNRGRTTAQVEVMPALQVALIYWLHDYRRFRDEYDKWVALPFWQGRAAVRQTAEQMRDTAARMEHFPFFEMLPAMDKIYEARVRLDCRVAALRCIEAVRLHAALHDGKLPASLNDISAVPVPLDPATGRSFEYAVAGDRVTLRGANALDGTPLLPNFSLHYELTFKR
jgi:hypothetical protein